MTEAINENLHQRLLGLRHQNSVLEEKLLAKDRRIEELETEVEENEKVIEKLKRKRRKNFVNGHVVCSGSLIIGDRKSK